MSIIIDTFADITASKEEHSTIGEDANENFKEAIITLLCAVTILDSVAAMAKLHRVKFVRP